MRVTSVLIGEFDLLEGGFSIDDIDFGLKLNSVTDEGETEEKRNV